MYVAVCLDLRPLLYCSPKKMERRINWFSFEHARHNKDFSEYLQLFRGSDSVGAIVKGDYYLAKLTLLASELALPQNPLDLKSILRE